MGKVVFLDGQGRKLVGILDFPKQKNPPVVIMLHGLNGHKTYYSFMNHLAEKLVNANYAVLQFDFNTHGESYNDWEHFTRKSCAKDFQAALAFIKRQKVDAKRIGVFATSMGATPFVLYAHSVKAAVLHNPFLLQSLWKGWIGGHEAEIRKRGYIELAQRKTGKKFKYGIPLFKEALTLDVSPQIKRVRCPVLLIFGEKDAKTLNAGQETYRLFSCKKQVKIVLGLRHSRTTPQQDEQISRLALAWFKKYLLP